MGDDDQLRFGQVKGGSDDDRDEGARSQSPAAGGGLTRLGGMTDVVIDVITLLIVLFLLYKVVEALLPLL